MKIFNMKFINILCSLHLLLIIGCLLISSNASSEYMPPNYIDIKEICEPGEGLPCADVQVVQGNVIIIREKILHSCWAKRDLSLFNKDIISTQENGRMRFSFIDGSLVTLSSMTELEITRNIYDRAAKARSLFFNMRSGKARFYVYKLDDLKFSETNVKTNTAVVVTIGSDFIVEVTDTATRVTALKDTRLKIISLAAPEVKPALIKDYERIVVKEGALPSEEEKLLQEEIETILMEFNIADIEGEKIGPKAHKDVYFSKDKLIEPEDLLKPGEEELVPFEIIEQMEDLWISEERSFEEIREDVERIFNEIREDEERANLPQFPRPPEK